MVNGQVQVSLGVEIYKPTDYRWSVVLGIDEIFTLTDHSDVCVQVVSGQVHMSLGVDEAFTLTDHSNVCAQVVSGRHKCP